MHLLRSCLDDDLVEVLGIDLIAEGCLQHRYIRISHVDNADLCTEAILEHGRSNIPGLELLGDQNWIILLFLLKSQNGVTINWCGVFLVFLENIDDVS